MKTLIRKGTVITAGDTIKADVLIEGEKIALIGSHLSADGCDEVIDAQGKLVMPGGIDAHTHLEMPFKETATADDFFTGQRAAAFGGTTTHVDFSTQQPGGTLVEGVKMWKEKAQGKAVIDYGFHAAITQPTLESVNEIPKLLDEGVCSLKAYQAYKGVLMVDDTILFRAMQVAAKHDVLMMTHCENGDVIAALTEDLVGRGKLAPQFHLDAHPASIEGEATARAIALAVESGAKLYIVHMSCKEAVEMLSMARTRGHSIMGETCTQYMFKFEDALRAPGFEGAKWVCGPPLRKPKDAQAIWRALKDGTLQTVATDHCSFNYEGGKDGKLPGKELGKEGWHLIPNGLPGIEDRMYMLYHGGVNGGRISLNRFVAITSTNPARALGMYPRKGTIAVGSDADIVIWDPELEKTISVETHHMNVDYNVYEGSKVRGFPIRTILRGKTIVDRGEWRQEKGAGQFIPRSNPEIL